MISVQDSGGFEGSSKLLKLGSSEGGTITYRYEHYTIPDRFIIRYDGRTLFDTGFTGGSATGTLQLPPGKSDSLQVLLATNDSGTAWNYGVTVESCPELKTYNFEVVGDTFKFDKTKEMCTAAGTFLLGHRNGTDPMLRIEGAKGEHDRNKATTTGGTYYAVIGGVAESLFSGKMDFSATSGEAKLSNVRKGNFKLADLDVDFKGMTMLSDKLAFDATFKLPDEASGLFVDTVKVGDDALIIDQNGARFAFGGKLNLNADVEFTMGNLVKVNASHISLTYRGASDSILFRSKIVMDDFFGGSGALKKITADLSGPNYIEVKSDRDVDVVGTLKVETEINMGLWSLSEIEIKVDTKADKVGGSAVFGTPFGVKFGNEGISVKPSFEVSYNPLQLEKIGFVIDNINKPIPAYPVFFWQSIGGAIANFADLDWRKIELTGTGGATLGPQIKGTSLVRSDLDITVSSKFIEGKMDNKLLTAEFKGFGKDLGTFAVANQVGTMRLDWSKGELTFKGTTNVMDGFFTAKSDFLFDSKFNFSASDSAAIAIPNFVPGIGGTRLAGGNYQFKFTNDDNFKNDYIAGWSTFTVPMPDLIAADIDVTLGMRIGFDGKMERIGAGNIPQTGSWQVKDGRDYLMVSAEWENAAPGRKLKVIAPDGRQIFEKGFAKEGIAIVDELTTATRRAVVIAQPDAGVWDVVMVKEAGLGNVTYQGMGSTPAPELSFRGTKLEKVKGDVKILYKAFDSDSRANITFWYDDDLSTLDGTLIGTAREMDGKSTFFWDTVGVAPGTYGVYAIIDDGNNAPEVVRAGKKLKVGSQTDLALKIDARQDEVLPFKVAKYDITVRNLKAGLASDASVQFDLPDGTTFSSASVPHKLKDGTLTLKVGDVPGKSVSEIDLALKMPGTKKAGPITLDGVVLTETYDFGRTNDLASETVIVAPKVYLGPDLRIWTKDLPSKGVVGKDFSYDVVVKNLGDLQAKNVKLTDTVTGASNLAANRSGTTLNAQALEIAVGTLAPGAKRTYTVSGTTALAGGVISHIVATAKKDINPTNNEILQGFNSVGSLPEKADLSVKLTDAGPDASDRAQATVTVDNAGPGVASNVEIAVSLPKGVTVDSWSTVQGAFDASTGIWSLGNLRDALGRDLTLALEGKGDARITAEVVSVGEKDPDSTPGNGVIKEDDFAGITISLGGGFRPTNGDDTITGTAGPDEIDGLGGNDTLIGGAGNDTIRGGTGDDDISGGGGKDRLLGNAGKDTINGGDQDDTIIGGTGNDILIGGDGADEFRFGVDDGTDTIRDFQPGIDTIVVIAVGSATAQLTGTSQESKVTFDDTTIVLSGIGFSSFDLNRDLSFEFV